MNTSDHHINYISVCSGAEAFGHDWHKMGFRPVFHSEIDPSAAAVLRFHYPDVPNLGDFTKINTDDYPIGSVRLLTGGTPCQAFSIAGLRGGLKDARGNLTLGFCGLAAELKPQWILWENVPGVLSSDGGRAFGSFLGALADIGYGFAYRVLDAQHFGVPQRRKRVFVVGHLGDWRRAAQVLFEPHSLQGHSAPRREKGQGITSPFTASALTGGGTDGNDGRIDFYVPDTSPTVSSKWAKGTGGPAGDEVQNLVAFDWNKSASQSMHVDGDISATLRSARTSEPAIAYTIHGTDGTATVASETETATCLRKRAPGTIENSSTTVAATMAGVRRLTPIECERLMGWPDVINEISIICLDHQSSHANVANQNLKSQRNAGSAENIESNGPASYVVSPSQPKHLSETSVAVVHVRINLEGGGLVIHSPGGLLLNVSYAELTRSLDHQKSGVFALVSALINLILVSKTQAGKGALPTSKDHSEHQKNGRHVVELFGRVSDEDVNDVARCISEAKDLLKFTISPVGATSRNCALSLQTLCSYAVHVISGCIPEKMLPENTYEIALSLSAGWTRYGIDAKGRRYELSDSARYKICGNGWARPVVNWIAERIMNVDRTL